MLCAVDVRVKGGSGRDAVRAAGLTVFPGFRLRVVARTPSTQDVVRAAARAGAAEGWCCVAGEQTAGRGRQGRRWDTPPGAALLMSVLLRPPRAVAGGVPLVGGLAVTDAIAALCPSARVGLKWPNDVLAEDGGKLAGVLAEVEPAAPDGPAVVLGIGLNLAVDGFPPEVAGASLHRLCGRQVVWEEMLTALLPALAARMRELERGGVAATVGAWRQRAVGIGSRVTVHTPHGAIEGIAAGVDDDGALLVDSLDGGRRRRLLAGDVSLSPRR